MPNSKSKAWVLLIIGVVFAAGNFACTSGKQPTIIRLLAYNIKHGQGNDDIVDLKRAAGVINALNPDLVALQEIDKGTERTEGVDQAARLGELTQMHALFGMFMKYQGGEYGMGLLSKYPIADWENHRLPEGREPRSALAARIRIGNSDQEIIFVSIHLYATPEEKYAQAEKVVDIFQDERTPVILAGDLNSTPDTKVIDLLKQSWVIPGKGDDHFTFRSDNPRREIDYIMFRPQDKFKVIESRVIDEPLVSDHRPLLLVVELLPD